jgi:rfaE bifunctional protein kinase chain/domain
MMDSQFSELFGKFSQVRVLVVGDVMLDRYWWGTVDRISPEAPVPVVQLEHESLTAGGAANVAANIKGLGAVPVLVGTVGDDEEGNALRELLARAGIAPEFLVNSVKRPTTVKTRIVAHQQQVARIDREIKAPLASCDEERVWTMAAGLLESCQIVIASDYDKGLLTDGLLSRLITQSKLTGKQILIDPKGTDYRKYKQATILTPNKKEALEASGAENVSAAAQRLLDELALEAVLVTRGEEGMSIFSNDEAERELAARARHVYDVTGAGDTVIATLAVALGAGAKLRLAAEVANLAAGFVVEEVGTTAITLEKLQLADGDLA